MSENITKSLLKLVHSKDLEVKESAIKVLGELGIPDKEVIKTLEEHINDKAKSVKLLSIEALSRFRHESILSTIDKMIDEEDEYAVNALKKYFANYGSTAVEYIASVWKNTRLEKKQHYLEILYMTKSKKSYELLLESILDNTPQISNFATKIIMEQFENLEEEFIDNFTKRVKLYVKNLAKTKSDLEQHITISLNIIKILKNIETHTSLNILEELFSLEIPQISTQVALAVIKLYQSEKLKEKNADDFAKLFKIIFDLTKSTQLENISLIYTEINKITLPTKFYNTLLDLYQNTSIHEVKKWIINYMNTIATSSSIEFLLKSLYKEHRELQIEIIAVLKKNPALSNTIIKELYKCKNAEIIPQLVDVLKSYKIIWPSDRLKEFTDNGIKMLQKSVHDQKFTQLYFSIAKGLFELTGSITPEIVRGKLIQEATNSKISKDFTMGELIFQILNTPLFATSDTRFEYAIFKLMTLPPDKLLDEKLYIISLDIFAELLKIPRFNLLERLKLQKKFLQSGHFLYIASYFIKGLPHERIFAKEVLKFITISYPKTNKTIRVAEELLTSTI